MPYPIPYIAILDVGHGNCSVLRDGEETTVIDCGAKSAGLIEFLEKEGISVINKLFISHADHDHIGGLIGLVATGDFTIEQIFFNSDGTKGSDVWNDLAYVLEQFHEAGNTKVTPGLSRSADHISCGAIGIEVTGPTMYLVTKGVGGKDHFDRTINSNSISASFNIHWKGEAVAFLAGDMDQIGLDDLQRVKANLKSPVLVYPHHGGKSSTGSPVPFAEKLCDEINPQTVLFSIGRMRFENPRPEVVKAVQKKIKDVRIACTQLSKHCIKKINVRISEQLVDVFSRGREDYFCCSGTFIIQLGDATRHFPELEVHQKFIKTVAPSPLCLHK